VTGYTSVGEVWIFSATTQYLFRYLKQEVVNTNHSSKPRNRVGVNCWAVPHEDLPPKTFTCSEPYGTGRGAVELEVPASSVPFPPWSVSFTGDHHLFAQGFS